MENNSKREEMKAYLDDSFKRITEAISKDHPELEEKNRAKWLEAEGALLKAKPCYDHLTQEELRGAIKVLSVGVWDILCMHPLGQTLVPAIDLFCYCLGLIYIENQTLKSMEDSMKGTDAAS